MCTGPASLSACLSGVLVLNNSFERLSQVRIVRTGRLLVQTHPLSQCTDGELEARGGKQQVTLGRIGKTGALSGTQ